MFDHSHYVPILRWKRGEKIALRELIHSQKNNITPLLELVPTNFKNCKKLIDYNKASLVIAQDLNKFWGNDNLFLDFRNINGLSPSNLDSLVLEEISQYKRTSVLNLIPVTTLYSKQSYNKTVRKFIKLHNCGICLRVDYASLSRINFQRELDLFMDFFRVDYNDIDLIVDYGIIDNDPDILSNIYKQIPNIPAWRTFIFTSGAFPENLSGVKPGQHEFDRDDWLYWLNNMYHNNPLRIPTYSDYTIQHPIFVEIDIPYNTSASIRYTSNNYWVIMRGEGLRNEKGPGHAQYPANAQLLMNRIEFCGAHFSYGDLYIDEIGSNLHGKTGSPETWLRAGINHHMAFVVEQLSNLSGT